MNLSSPTRPLTGTLNGMRSANGAPGATALMPPGATPTSAISGETWSTLINLAGRQRMLSQRIALLVQLTLQGDDHARQQGQDALQQFMRAHEQLSRGGDGLPAPSPGVEKAFFGSDGADQPIRQFVEKARLALRNADPEAARQLIGAATPMLARLNRLTELFEADARASAQASRARYTDLLDDIRRIAGEAKFITMNARIMAARAGDAGREFAVVAARLAEVSGEIENLSAQAARRI